MLDSYTKLSGAFVEKRKTVAHMHPILHAILNGLKREQL